MKRKKYTKWIGDDNYDSSKIKIVYTSQPSTNDYSNQHEVPNQILIKAGEPGIFFGIKDKSNMSSYIGMPQKADGNAIVIGGNGSGKSSGIAKPTLRTWNAAICATDIKGELSDYYKILYENGKVTRSYIIFDPTNPATLSYDPFDWLLKDNEVNLLQNIWDITIAIVPSRPEEMQPFWTQTEQAILAAALLYHFTIGLSFSESICRIATMPLSSLFEEIIKGENICTKILLGETINLKPEILAEFDRGLRNKIMLFAADPYISHAFRGVREGAKCFTWADLDECNIFLRVPADMVDQWSGAINLMYSQLIRHLERKPDMYSISANSEPVLLLMDEFARFGKLENMATAMSTLRSKNVTICPIIQSIAQLDKLYGECDRRIILDNCQFQVILRANDADTQKLICEMIGSTKRFQRCMSENMDDFYDTIGYSKSATEIREFHVFPHELSSLDDILLITPHGFCRAEKYCPTNTTLNPRAELTNSFPEKSCIRLKATSVCAARDLSTGPDSQENRVIIHATGTSPKPKQPCLIYSKQEEEIIMLTIEERTKEANRKVTEFHHQQRRNNRQQREALEKKEQRQNYIIGKSFARFFPMIRILEPGTADENAITFKPLETFFSKLSEKPDLVEMLSTLINDSVKENICSIQCISGQTNFVEQTGDERR